MKPSQGAREIAEKIFHRSLQPEVGTMAALIDEELRELLPYLQHGDGCPYPLTTPAYHQKCTCGLAALLEKWQGLA